jgi:hypothetical protein
VRSVQARPLTRCGYRHAGHQGCSGAVNNRTRLGSYPPGFRPSSFVTNGPSKYEPCTTPARGKRHAPTGAADSRACTRLLRLRGPISEARVCASALVRAVQKASSVRGGRHICSMFAVRVHGSTSGARRSGRTSGQSARGDRSEGCAERRLPSVGAPQLNGLKFLTQQRPAKRELSAECIGCKAGGRAWTTDPSRTVR